jgi:hypothetical protein
VTCKNCRQPIRVAEITRLWVHADGLMPCIIDGKMGTTLAEPDLE